MFEAVLQGDDDDRAFRRALGVSVAAHLALLGLALVNPFPNRSFERPAGVVEVSLVAAVPGPPAAAAAPAAKPAAPKPAPPPKEPPKEAAKPVPPPEAPQVRADKKLLPKEAVRTPKPPPPKPKPAVKPPEEELDYADALSSLREELGEPADAGDAPDPELLASVKPGRSTGRAGMGGSGDPLDPLIAAWIKRVKIHVSRAWVLEPSLKRQVLESEVVVTLDASGRVLGVHVERRSGNSFYDESVTRAIEKASPLPPPPEDGDWAFLFTPQDMF